MYYNSNYYSLQKYIHHSINFFINNFDQKSTMHN